MFYISFSFAKTILSLPFEFLSLQNLEINNLLIETYDLRQSHLILFIDAQGMKQSFIDDFTKAYNFVLKKKLRLSKLSMACCFCLRS